MLSERVWIDTKFLARSFRVQRWRAVAMRGEQQVGPVVFSHSRKSARAKAYGALAATHVKQPEEQR